ncbi:MAG: hypothetical protein ABID84_00830 [Chloroflexota bacterium]
MKKAWSGWKRALRVIGNFQATVLLTLTYLIFVPVVAVPFKLLSDPLRIKKHHAAFIDTSGIDRASLEAARKQ